VTEVRPALAGDFDQVVALLEELGRPKVDDPDGARAVWDSQLSDPEAAHLVAEDEAGAVVGFCSLHFRSRLNHLTPEAWIPDLIVAEARRSQGVGHALLAEAERLSRERGCHELSLESAHFRKRAHAFYEAFGMEQPAITFGKPLV
jgi:GNAT superfamily N-acetyltransferase